MFKMFKKFLLLVSLFFLYLIGKEFLILYQAASNLHAWAGYGVLVLFLFMLIYFVLIPIIRIAAMPPLDRPTRDPDKIPALIKRRMKRLAANKSLVKAGIDISQIHPDRDGYEKAIFALDPQLEAIRKKYVTQVFYATSIAQNGFLDGMIILSSGVNVIRDIFVLYNGRAANRDVFFILKQVYYSMLIGGSESVEYAADEIISKVFSGSVKTLPFASKIFGSIADGFVNAALITRISIIAENSCKRLFIESEKVLYPSSHTVVSATKILTSDIFSRVSKEVKKLAGDKTRQVVLATVNPVGYIMGKALNHYADESETISIEKREFVREMSQIAHNPFSFVFQKMRSLFSR